MSTFIKSTNNRREASYRDAYHLGAAGKPYFDGELVKRCLIDVVKCIHPGKKADYLSLALSRYTIQRWQDNIAKQLSLSVLWTNRLTLRTLRSYWYLYAL